MTYKKTCMICKNEFESESANAKYCSEKCSKRGVKKAYRSRKMKHIKSKEYPTDKMIEKLINKAHVFARELAEQFLTKVCSCTDTDHECSNDLVVHHIDHNCFNNDLTNLQWLCSKAHAELHSKEKDCNMPQELKAYLTLRQLESTTPKEKWDDLYNLEEYNESLQVIHDQLNIRSYNMKLIVEQLNPDDYEYVTGEKKPGPNLTLV